MKLAEEKVNTCGKMCSDCTNIWSMHIKYRALYCWPSARILLEHQSDSLLLYDLIQRPPRSMERSSSRLQKNFASACLNTLLPEGQKSLQPSRKKNLTLLGDKITLRDVQVRSSYQMDRVRGWGIKILVQLLFSRAFINSFEAQAKAICRLLWKRSH